DAAGLNGVVQRLLLIKRQQHNEGAEPIVVALHAGQIDRAVAAVASTLSRRKDLEGIVIIVQREAKLLDIVRALAAAGSFASRLNGGQKQRHQHTDNGDDDQQLD